MCSTKALNAFLGLSLILTPAAFSADASSAPVPPATPEKPSQPVAAPPAKPAPPKPGRQVLLKMAEGLRFDPPRFEAQPGERLQIRLENVDTTHQPHNFVIVKPGMVQQVVKAAMELGDSAPKQGFLPKHPAVIASSAKVLNPQSRAGVDFTVPMEPGVYGYVCTVPGHGMIMYGAMYVGVAMPPLAQDTNIPQLTVEKGLAGGGRRPFVQRIFLPDASPAAIGVALPGKQNYCFDASECRVRYAWSGPFIDGSNHWRGNGKALPELGNTPWWTSAAFPLQFGSNAAARPKVQFLGYKLREGLPTFHFKADNCKVLQTVQPSETGLELRFEVSNANAGIVFLTNPGARWSCPQGEAFEKGFRIPAKEASSFSVLMEPESAPADAPAKEAHIHSHSSQP